MLRNIYITIPISIFLTMLCSCTTDHTSLLSQTQKTGGEIRLDNIENSLLRKGHVLARTECAECHRFYSPEEYTPEEWDRIIKEKAQRLSIRKDQVEALDYYFKTESIASE